MPTVSSSAPVMVKVLETWSRVVWPASMMWPFDLGDLGAIARIPRALYQKFKFNTDGPVGRRRWPMKSCENVDNFRSRPKTPVPPSPRASASLVHIETFTGFSVQGVVPFFIPTIDDKIGEALAPHVHATAAHRHEVGSGTWGV